MLKFHKLLNRIEDLVVILHDMAPQLGGFRYEFSITGPTSLMV